MKQVSYEFNMRQITRAFASYTPDLEDGCYHWILDTESVSSSIPRVFVEQRPDTFPGHIVRITGIKVVKLPVDGVPAQKDDTFFMIKNGEVLFYGDDRTPSGPIQVDEGAGANS